MKRIVQLSLLSLLVCSACERGSEPVAAEGSEPTPSQVPSEAQVVEAPAPPPSADVTGEQAGRGGETGEGETGGGETSGGETSGGETGGSETEGASAPPATGPFTAPGEVLRRAREGLAYVGQDSCEPGEAFPSFTPEPSRWVHFRGDWARVEVIVMCSELNLAGRIDIHPHDQPNRRYVVFFSEAGMAVELREGERWSRACDGRRCKPEASDSSAAWIAGHDLDALDPEVSALRGLLHEAIPAEFESLSTKPLFAAGTAKGYIVYAESNKLVARRPDGSAPLELGLSAPDRFSESSRGPANNKPLVSHDGLSMAYLPGGKLTLFELETQAARPVELGQGALIAQWSPDDDALLVYADSSFALVDSKTLAVTPLASQAPKMFGDSAAELATSRAAGDRVDVLVGPAPDFAGATALLQLAGLESWIVQDLRAGAVAGIGKDRVWVHHRRTNTTHEVRTSVDYGTRVRLSPSGKHMAFVAPSPKGSRLFVAGTDAAAPADLFACDKITKFYWYDADHLVIPGKGAIYLVGLDGRTMVVAEGMQVDGMAAGRAR